jgi:hypothetical protein
MDERDVNGNSSSTSSSTHHHNTSLNSSKKQKLSNNSAAIVATNNGLLKASSASPIHSTSLDTPSQIQKNLLKTTNGTVESGLPTNLVKKSVATALTLKNLDFLIT